MRRCKDGQDLLTTAAFEALMAADRLAEAIRAVEVSQALTTAQLDPLRDLRPAAITPAQIDPQAVEALRGLAECLQPKIQAETTTWFVQSEHDPSCGDEETVTSDNGCKLIRLRSALLDLAERLAILRCEREAERVAELLRK